MRSTVHLFDGYVMTEGSVRARCSCGYLSTPQAAQRPARLELSQSHGFALPVCDNCGRRDAITGSRGLDRFWLRVDPIPGQERVLCAPGTGGCDPSADPKAELTGRTRTTSSLGNGATGSGTRNSADAHRGTVVAMAQGVIIGRWGLRAHQARSRLEELAAHQGITLLEAANQVLHSARQGRHRSQPADDRA